MKRFGYILIALLAVLTACHGLEPEITPVEVPAGEKVTISFDVAVPGEPAETRAMGINPTIDPDGFYIAVFGGSGYFNEWVKATVTAATANYDGTDATKYSLTANLSVSDSRLRLHFIANCPTAVRTSPPISGSADTEENVLSKIRSQQSETFNDGYWQKVILPNGVRAQPDPENPQVNIPTPETKEQFPKPIVLVRNFARVYLRNITPTVGTQGENEHQLVKIKKFALAYAPSEGVIAPILSAPYTSNNVGTPIAEPDDDDTTTEIYYENFFINYQNKDLEGVTAAPYNYGGYSPANQAYNYYPNNTDPNTPLEADMKEWDDEHPESNVLFVYERTMPTGAKKATRLIIKAERIDGTDYSEGDKYYALDIVNNDGVAIPLLRNQTYTVLLKNIEAGTGESDITQAANATSATVIGNPNFQKLVTISDGKSSIGTSFTERFYVSPQTDTVMFRYIPTNVADENYEPNQEGNELVTIQVGTVKTETGVFTAMTPDQASSILAFKTENGNYKVAIQKDANDKAISYVRSNNTWVEATAAQIDDSTIEKWGMIVYELNDSYKDSNNYFTEERTMAIHVSGTYQQREMSRNVIIKTSPRQQMHVICQEKYVFGSAGQPENVQILIPTGLSRSVFPLEFMIEAAKYSLTPNGDVLPVDFGSSIVPDNDEPAFYFVKTLTQTAYDGLSTVNYDGATWKSFVCHFKTTLADNASVVYVQNRYFMEANSSDEFFNYVQRQFTWQTVPGSVYRHANTTVTFVLDDEHGNPVVWWDPENALEQSTSLAEAQAKGLSSTNRVLPPIMTVVLNGYEPQRDEYDHFVTEGLVSTGQNNTYLYHVGSGTPTSDLATVSLALTAIGSIGSNASVTLSTANITDCPELYLESTSSTATIQGAKFSNVSFGGTYLQTGLDRTATFSFSYQSGLVVPITVSFDGLAINGTDTRFTSNGDGTYTFTPTNTGTTNYSFSVKTTTQYLPGTITLTHDDYELAEKTIARQGTFNIPIGALRARNGAGNGNPSNFTTGNNTYVYMNNTATYNYKARSYFSSSYLNNSAMTVTLSDYTYVNGDATVYFVYRANNNNNVYYYATVSLRDLVNATASNPLDLRFKSSKTVTISTTSTTYSNNRLSYSNNDVTVAFSSLTNRQYNYVTIPTSATVTVSCSSGYHVEGMTLTYRSGGNTYYVPQNVAVNTGSYSGSTSSASATWTKSNETDSVVFTMTRGNNDIRLSSIAVTLIED